MSIILGLTPTPLTVTLARGGSFVATLVSTTDWAADTQIALSFTTTPTSTPIVWAATISGPNASWDVSPSAVAAVLDADASHVQLTYASGGDTLIWAKGRTNGA